MDHKHNKAKKTCLHTNTLHSLEHDWHKYNLHETPQYIISIQSYSNVIISSSFSIAKISIGTNCFQ